MKYFLIICSSLWVSGYTYGQIKSVTVTGSWSASVTTTITEAGLNYTGNVTSASDQSLIDISAQNNDPYTVTIQEQDTDWNSNVTVWARRTGVGTGGTAISGGVDYIQLIASAQFFFSGAIAQPADPRVVGIPIQYEIRGLSVLVPVKSYSTTIIYTVTSP
jgi:hypothetical protein